MSSSRSHSAGSASAESSKPCGVQSLAARNWDRAHAAAATSTDNGSVPSRLYTDENPATTIKGTGFKNRAIAERTIRLTSQPGVRYKQYWTIRAMRERAVHHPHLTDGMREAILVFDEWLGNYSDPTTEERKVQEKEWEEFRSLCNSVANHHAYGKIPTQDELKRARQDLQEGQKILVDLLSVGLRSSCNGEQNDENGLRFPITKFTALFGGPGMHGYGKHTFANPPQQAADDGIVCHYASSQIDIDGSEGVEELIGKAKATKLGLVAAGIQIIVRYNRSEETATVEVEQGQSGTLKDLWTRGAQRSNAVEKNNSSKTNLKEAAVDTGHDGKGETSWACNACTFVHEGKAKASFLACELCLSERTNGESAGRPKNEHIKKMDRLPQKETAPAPPPPAPTAPSPTSPSSWGCLRAPTQGDITGPRKRRKVLDEPPPMMDYLIVLDFEWTADDKRKMEPIAEITQFPSVALKLYEAKTTKTDGECSPARGPGSVTRPSEMLMSSYVAADIRVPEDLRPSSAEPLPRRDAHCVSIFDTFVRPTLIPKLTKFSIELTGITQDEVDRAPTIDRVVVEYMKWLRGLGLVDSEGNRVGNWCFTTWGDVDLMSTLRKWCTMLFYSYFWRESLPPVL
mmetsp:Transcript_30497/g.89167  ORF Transcript_30497/g.89167 Transcript_30497/m.89167 type:complete len:628 (-) Transcript_30497:1188-3071(-)